jgi:pimeloyl-ACP methyl ester carboxylesterase
MTPSTSIEQKRIRDLGITYALRAGGDTCVLFIHGLGCDRSSFLPAFDGSYFDDRYSLLAPDLPGHGESQCPEDFDYDLERQGDLLGDLVRTLQPRRLIVVAHSMGNVPGLLLARSLANLDGYFCLEGNFVLSDCNISSRILRYSEADFATKLYTMGAAQFRCKGVAQDHTADATALYRCARSLVDWSAGGLLPVLFRGLDCIKVYLHGSESDVAAVIKVIDGETVVQILDTGHFLMLDQADAVYREVVARLEATDR